jgi:hypothetical protein
MPRTRLPPAAAGAAALAALALAAPSLAGGGDAIVPGRSIGPVAIGDERAAIAARHGGDGTIARRTPDPAHPGNRNLDRVVVRYRSLSLVARFPTDEASSGAERLTTRSARYLTGRGIGVGSSRGALRAAHPAAACAGAVCQIGRALPGRVVTRFHLSAGRVVAVSLERHPRA